MTEPRHPAEPRRRGTAGIDAVATSLARQVRALRQGRGWSLDELAQRSGVSKGMVVQIEGSRTNPSIGTLCLIAEAFGVTINRLIEPLDEPTVKIIGADEPPVLWRGDHGGVGRLLRGVNDPAIVEVWHWRLAPGDVQTSADHAPGTREILHVQTGTLTVTVDAADHVLRAGETVDLRADRPHGYRNDGDEETVVMMTVVTPKGEHDRRP